MEEKEYGKRSRILVKKSLLIRKGSSDSKVVTGMRKKKKASIGWTERYLLPFFRHTPLECHDQKGIQYAIAAERPYATWEPKTKRKAFKVSQPPRAAAIQLVQELSLAFKALDLLFLGGGASK
jgi:hypothetical protein